MTLRIPKTCLQRTQHLSKQQSVDLAQEVQHWCFNCRLLVERMFISIREVAWEYPCVETLPDE